MQSFLKFILTIVLAGLILFIVRTYLFTVYSVPNEIPHSELRQGDRVIVNRLKHANMQRGDLIVFGDSVQHIAGVVVAIPGDTITVNKERFYIPLKCCHRCVAKDCKCYLVNTAIGKQLVHQEHIVGEAYRLFNLKLWQ